MAAALEISCAERREVVPLTGETISLGRAPSNTVVPNAPTVSRLHTALVPLPGGWVVRDLGSRNGTFVNGSRLRGDQAL